MAHKKSKQRVDVSARAFLNYARHYQAAADELSAIASQGRQRPELAVPTTFLYSHTIELAFKAFLRAHGRGILGTACQTHDLEKLYEECRRLGLVNDPVDIGNVVELLNSGSEDQALRYFTLRPTGRPETSWTRDVVDRLLRTVEGVVDERCKSEKYDRAVKIDLTIGRPERKK